MGSDLPRGESRLRFPGIDASFGATWSAFSGGVMGDGIERRASRRFTMTLPLTVRLDGPSGVVEQKGHTRDVSFRGLYFMIDAGFEPGHQIEFVLTLPKEFTHTGDVHIRCFGQVVRVEEINGHRGVAARIERYEFLPA
jgi:PilZ domain